MPEDTPYNVHYYENNKQDKDRLALWFYYRLAKSYVKKGRVLDYGSGTGHLIKRFKKDYISYAYDFSPYALSEVKRIAPHVTVVDSEEDLKGVGFDLIISLHVLEHIEDPTKSIEFFRGLLKDKGMLIFVVPNISGLGRLLKKDKWAGFKDKTHVSLYMSLKWLNLVKKCGFQIVKTGTDGLWDVPYLPFIPNVLQKLIFYPMTGLQVVLGRLIWPNSLGESLVVICRKSK